MAHLEKTTDAVLITGPTASGKSALALDLARRHNGVVINADSMQVYDVLRVLTARPSTEDMDGIEHQLYGHVDPSLPYSTGDWLRDVEGLIARLRDARRMPIVVGGTGLYFKALTGGLSQMPAIPEEIRTRWRTRLLEEGPERLHAILQDRDPEMAARLGRSDGQRIVRALEVLDATGRSISSFQTASGPVIIDPERALKYVVLPDRQVLADRINRRFAGMLEQGAVEEVERLETLRIPGDMPAMKAIGVSQIRAMLRGEMDRDAVIEKSAAATRQYAKRQMTWFRNQMDESWQRLDPDGPERRSLAG